MEEIDAFAPINAGENGGMTTPRIETEKKLQSIAIHASIVVKSLAAMETSVESIAVMTVTLNRGFGRKTM
ncbi:MAG: hypothetical protein HGJ98_16320 [Desulfosporosinus sp.]|nr:hypothetical protein [Desulfosporosinus sp.]